MNFLVANLPFSVGPDGARVFGNVMTVASGNHAVTDITPLYGLKKLKLLDGAMNEIPQEQIDEITELMPDCRMTVAGIDTHEIGWRKEYNGKYYDWYLEVREIFGYGRNDFSGKSW